MESPLNLCSQDREPWYVQGLRFKCTECGRCCTGFPGATWISEEEIKEIADHLSLSPEEFQQRYTRIIRGRVALQDEPHTYSCVFLKSNKCSIYPVRPKQCRTYPWWVQNLDTPQDWQEAARLCEGINHAEAPLISKEEILTLTQR